MTMIDQDYQEIHISVPGRICLFGEHQDYLRLPIIAAAIDLRVSLKASKRSDRLMNFNLLDLGVTETFDPNVEQEYRHDRDYLPAAMNVLRRKGIRWDCGYDVEIKSDIPINSGASSSSALQVAYCSFLLAAADDERASDPISVAWFAYESEVLEFNSPGGMMDHFSTACGGVIWMDSKEPKNCIQLDDIEGEFLLVDSGVPKDTNGVLGSIRKSVESMNVDFSTLPLDENQHSVAEQYRISQEVFPRLEANMINRGLTHKAKELLWTEYTPTELGNLLNQHHAQLSENLGVSHPKIDEMLQHGMSVGAYGGKINGSGGGGSFFFYAGQRGESLKKEFEKLGYRCWRVQTDAGLQVEYKIESKESKVS